MDYKEKLRLAKEALDSGSYDKETIEYIFPELKEGRDDRVRNKLVEFFKGYYPDKEWWGNITQRDILAWFEEQDKQKSWSEEDKMQLDAAIHLVSNTGHIETANWLKALKDRVQPQQGWSEEDKVIRNALVKFVELLYSYGSGIYDLDKNQFLDWLQKLENRISK